MHNYHGIIPADNAQYLMVSLRENGRGRESIRIRRWNCQNRVRALLLLQKDVSCGIPSFWKSPGSAVGEDAFVVSKPDRFFSPCANQGEIGIHSKRLGNNLLAIVPEDAFLCTLPLRYGDPSITSFLSIYPSGDYFKIGIILNGELLTAFCMAPCANEALAGHLLRISHYCQDACPEIAFPANVYMFGKKNLPDNSSFTVHPLEITVGNHPVRSSEELKALGAALAQKQDGVPVFSDFSSQRSFHKVRMKWFEASAAMIAFAIFAVLALFLSEIGLNWKLHSYETHYQAAISGNAEIKTLAAQNELLGKNLLKLETKMANRTQWSRLLQVLGAQRPEGLFFEKLGCEPVKGSTKQVRIALAGSAKNESIVTDIIALLHKTGFIVNVSLSALEKDEKDATLCNFRIICVMNISSAS